MKRLILASASPRRQALLSKIIPAFDVLPSAFEEIAEGLSAQETAKAFAIGKAREVFSRHPDCAVLGADTVVSVDGMILGKPVDETDAARMLRLLSGREHDVFTGVCLIDGQSERAEVAQTRVRFFPLSEEKIRKYIQSGSPMDKAGAYGIQDGGLVQSYEGSYSNVVGLPIELIRDILKEGGLLC